MDHPAHLFLLFLFSQEFRKTWCFYWYSGLFIRNFFCNYFSLNPKNIKFFRWAMLFTFAFRWIILNLFYLIFSLGDFNFLFVSFSGLAASFFNFVPTFALFLFLWTLFLSFISSVFIIVHLFTLFCFFMLIKLKGLKKLFYFWLVIFWSQNNFIFLMCIILMALWIFLNVFLADRKSKRICERFWINLCF